MNNTERIARQWVAEKHSIPEEEVVYSCRSTPDLVTPDGTKYEVKRLYGDKIILFPVQVATMREQSDIQVLVFAKGVSSPLATILSQDIISALDNGSKTVMNIHLVIVPNRTDARYQVFLGDSLQARFNKYLDNSYTEDDKVYSATFRKALEEFLVKRGY